tara:strand:+ start:3358 stop:3927 length:570 start_codon:yes stop_codon:yes gene_type:complete
MDTILKVIDSVTNDRLVKSIINSVNDNQEKSKDWLIEKSKQYLSLFVNPKICVAAGWYGHLANRLTQYTDERVQSFDIDPITKKIGQKLYPNVWFKIEDIIDYKFEKWNVVICTSCEHLKQEVIDNMIDRCKNGSLIILQSNNYKQIDEHINCHNSLEEFEKTLKLKKILYKGTLELDKYNRYMIIGTK